MKTFWVILHLTMVALYGLLLVWRGEQAPSMENIQNMLKDLSVMLVNVAGLVIWMAPRSKD
jgi:hypothetical protein